MRYYYASLSKSKMQLCNRIVSQLKKGRQNFEVFEPLIQAQEIFDVISVIDKDFPEIFFLDIKRKPAQISQIGFLKKVYIPFAYSMYQIRELQSEIEKILQALSVQVYRANSIEKKEKILYDYLTTHVTYDYAVPIPMHYTIVGPLIYHKAICEGFAKAFKFLCDYFSIPCLIVSGTSRDSSSGQIENHSWNIIQLDDGNYYHADVTWDCSSKEYMYLNLSDSEMSTTHSWNQSEVPICNHNRNQSNYPYFISASALNEYMKNVFRLKQKKFAFRVNHDFQTTEVVLDLLRKIAERNPEAAVRHISVLYYREQGLIKCEFSYF